MTIFLLGQALPILQQTSGHVTGQSNKVAQSGLSESHGKYGPEREKTCRRVCEQHRRRPAFTSAQSDQRLYYSLSGKYHM